MLRADPAGVLAKRRRWRAAQGELKLAISASRQATGEADPNGHPVNGRSAERARHGWRAPDLLAVQECTATQGLARFSGA
ncbi:MAG: hypothetical protein QNJ82_06095, partial [Gammaproteobacteria bacterium]|nr:hypothetical protein [Gammaproteobacteria bacterium]